MNSSTHYPDHFVVGINHLQTGIEQFRALTGVNAVIGGVHPHIGTCNALVSIGERSYLEIIAPDPAADPARLDPELSALFRDPLSEMQKLTPYLWVVGSSDLDHTVNLLSRQGIDLSSPAPGSRKKPDGRLVEWRASFVNPPAFAGAPFFIQWLDPSTAPATDSPAGCRLEHYSVTAPGIGMLQKVKQSLALDVELYTAAQPAIEIILNSPRGRISL